MMKRKQIQLTARQAQALRREAARRGLSDAAVIRALIDDLDGSDGRRVSDDKWDRAFSAVGRFRSGRTDIARNHDRYLADAFRRK